MNLRRILIGVLVVVGLAATGYVVYQEYFAPPADGESETSESGSPDDDSASPDVVSAEGRVVPLSDSLLSFQSGGRVVQILVAAGDVVNAGDSLVQLDTVDQEIAVTQAEAAVVQANANLESALAGVSAAEIGLHASEVAVQVAEAQLALTAAKPTAEQIALGEALVALGTAQVSSAAGAGAAALEVATAAQIAAAQAQVTAAQAQFDAAEKILNPLLQNPDANADVRSQARSQYNVAAAGLAAARAAMDELLAGPTIAEQTAAGGGIAAASSQRDASQAELELLLLGASEERIAVAAAAVAAAEESIIEGQLQVDQARAMVAQAQAAVGEAEAGLSAAQLALDKRTLRAPVMATVADIPVKEGQIISPGVPVVILADFGGWLVETTDLSELDVVDLQVGLDVDVVVDAFPSTTLPGTVTDIATTSDIVLGDTTYQVTVDMGKDVELPLRWGMTAFATFDSRRPDASGAQNGGAESADGQVAPLFEVALAFQTGGTIAEILVSDGDVVTTGAPLVRLASEDVALLLQQAQARKISAEAARDLAGNQLALAEAAVGTAEARVQSAEAALALTIAGPRDEEIAAAESAVAAGQAAINQAAGQRDSALNVGTAAQISAAEAQLAAAQAATRVAQDQVDAVSDSCFDLPDGTEVCPLAGPFEENARAQLEVAQMNQAAAQAALDAVLAGPTAAQGQAAQGAVTVSVASRDIAQAQLDMLLAGPTPEQIAIAEVAVLQAQVGVELAEAAVEQARAAVVQAEAGVVQADAGVASAEAAMERMTLRSTIAGEVSRLAGNIGELVSPGMPVVTVADYSAWLVKTTNLTELDVVNVNAGDSVMVSFDALPGEKVPGIVREVALLAGFSLGEVVYEVTIELQEVDDWPLRWGMTALVEF